MLSRRALWWFAGAVAAVLGAVAVVAVVLVATVVVVAVTAGRQGERWTAPTSSSVAVSDGAVPDRYREAFDYALTLCPQLPAPVLAAQITQESGWRPDAVSHAGARGLGQFMPGTWAEHAVDANGGGADIFDPADSLASAASYDCYLLEQVTGRGYEGDPISLMLAAYNAGPGAVQRYRGVPPPSFSRGETHGYVESITAMVSRFTVPTTPGLVVAGSVPSEPLPAWPIGADGVAPNAEFARRWADATFGTRTPVSACAHGGGHTCEIAVTADGEPPDASQVQLGWAVANALVEGHAGLGVREVSWQGRTWTTTTAQWLPEGGPPPAEGAAGVVRVTFDSRR
ncbi:Transglycosylase SLT domain-containing protein [Quadrisphaera granulorum]|uniref:Transglycosylase-like protein with SLT domain n=1 Tax=Quadrisphaera granulorum TaxID=317664 RepID=A0A316AY47_9ACTN|nr:lytic transglycosylase domain-containing protein [Quadrisphaera granulorum]PWJ55137.1 transglycosylase-like protein with SLT domain [Quadrisphaera granulorum]SZE95646.1 Transglycosylase SLT domain-containing protein [Quadrisphaera granulorum]